MSSFTVTSKLYRDYMEIEVGAYHTLVRFYEANAPEIASMKFEKYFEILVHYTNALFEIGAYAKHLKEVDKIILLSIEQNIQFFHGEDIFYKSLFRKAASFYNLLELDKATYIIKELIKISPYDGSAIQFLKKCGYHARPTFLKNARAISIILFLLATLFTAIEVLFIYPFSPNNAPLFENLRSILFVFGLLVLGGSFLFHRYQVNRAVNIFVQQTRRKKQGG